MEDRVLILNAVFSGFFVIILLLISKHLWKYICFQIKLNKLPGPKRTFLLGNTLDFIGLKQTDYIPKFRSYWEEHHSKGLFRIELLHVTFVLLTTPENVERFLSSSHYIEKADLYHFLYPWLGVNLLTSGGSKWRERRKMLTPTFHFKILEEFVEVFNKHSEVLVNKLEPIANGNTFDIYPFITLCALDIICETAMGTNKINAQENHDSEYVKALYEISTILYKRMFGSVTWNDFFFWFTPSYSRHAKCVKILHDFTDKVIAERKAEMKVKSSETTSNDGKKKRLAFLDLLLQISENGNKLSDKDLRAEVDTFMFEGHDTTSSGISWTLYMLGAHPEVQDKVYEEINDIFGDNKRPVTLEDLQSLKYMECVIKESLRINPPVPMFARSLLEDITIGNYTLPRGCTPTLYPYLLHRDPKYFPEPEKFDPDRFLPENSIGRHPFAYIPFSAGPRNCIGQKFAMMEEKIILTHVLRSYRMESVEKPKDMKKTSDIILRPENGFNMKFYER